jgi:hypothetical protein
VEILVTAYYLRVVVRSLFLAERTAVIRDSKAWVGIGDQLVCLSLPSLEIKWHQKIDDATCFGLYVSPDGMGLLVHGELIISKVTFSGGLIWSTSGKDIFTEGFSVNGDYIKAVDFNNERYRIEIANGQNILVKHRCMRQGSKFNWSNIEKFSVFHFVAISLVSTLTILLIGADNFDKKSSIDLVIYFQLPSVFVGLVVLIFFASVQKSNILLHLIIASVISLLLDFVFVSAIMGELYFSSTWAIDFYVAAFKILAAPYITVNFRGANKKVT